MARKRSQKKTTEFILDCSVTMESNCRFGGAGRVQALKTLAKNKAKEFTYGKHALTAFANTVHFQ
jgi:hypothetical protein